MNTTKQIFIIGGGYSVSEGINKGLWNKLNNKFSIGLNFCSPIFIPNFPLNPTFNFYVDSVSFYKNYNNQIKDLPLVIGRKSTEMKIIHSNTILMRFNEINYTRDLSKGIYCAYLAGVGALSLAIYLLDEGEIFLLGNDCGAVDYTKWNIENPLYLPIKHGKKTFNVLVEDASDKWETIKNSSNLIKTTSKVYRVMSHWYQKEFDHKGVGRISFYHATNKISGMFEVFKNEQKCKIYTVGLSNLDIFPKLTYDEFFQRIDNNNLDQEELRNFVKEKLNSIALKC